MAEIFQDISTSALTQVIDHNLIEKSLSFPRFFNGEIHKPNPVWFITGETMPNNNGVARATFGVKAIDQEIETLRKAFKAKSLPLVWWVGPSSTPNTLGKNLQEHGFVHNRDMIGMAMDLHELKDSESVAPHLKVVKVQDASTLKQWYTVLLRCFPMTHNQSYLDALQAISLRPNADWIHYVGYQDDKIVASSSLFLGGGVAGLYNLGTHPKLRGQGIGETMTRKTYQMAREQGYRVGTLQTTYPNALRMYHRMGFEVYCKIGIYRYYPFSNRRFYTV